MTAPTPYTTSQISIFDVDFSSFYLNVLLQGNKWGGPLGSAATVYYSFPTSRNDAYWSQDPINGYGIFDPMSDGTPDYVSLTPLSSSQQNGITLALNAWASVANLDFIKVDETPDAVGDIRFGFTLDGAMSQDVYAYSYSVDPTWYDYSDIIPYTRSGDIWFNKNQPDQTGNNFSTGAMGYFVGLHEIGHALGLDHSFSEEDGDLGLPTNIEYIQYTVMSYSDLPGSNFDGFNEYYPTTPMLYDILAIQHLYGANNSYNADDTVYEFSSSQRYYQTIWDGGGNDTIKYTSSIGGVINLEAGSFSQLGKAFKVGVNNNTVQKDNIAIAFNVVIENAIGGSGNDRITGNSADNRLEGAAGDDILDGGIGADTLIGGKGNDTYIVDDVNDVVIENLNEGTDLVKASVSYTLSAYLENLTLIGTFAINGTGNDFNNIITGNDYNNALYGNAGMDTLNGASGSDILDGGAGVDKLIGGAGHDTYIVDLVRTGTTAANYKIALQDTITETAVAGSGTDTVILRGTFIEPTSFTTLTLSANLENLDASLTGETKLNLTGNALANTLKGNDANNILDGGAGVDTLIGGLGDDTYMLDLKVSAGNIVFDDSITEYNGTTEGIDTVKLRGTTNLATAIDISLNLWANIETLDASATGTTKLTLKGNDEDNTLIGNNAANILEGGLGNDILNGGAGADTMIGGKGWDTYYVDNIKDVIVELENTDHVLADEGIDTILSSISLSLANYDNVEYLTLLGKANLNATGNDGSNLLIGNAGNNILDGGGNRDNMQGGAGNDTYIVDNINDQAIETIAGAAGGIDIVLSSVSFALNYNVENLTLTGTENIDGYGNELNNTIRGNAGNNRLGGGGDGSDILIGGAGNDIYEVTYLFASSAKPVAQDTVIESLNAGIDSIILSAAGNNGLLNKYLMPLNVENLDATNTYGAFSHLIGNNSANYIIGNDYSHIFDGGAGVDTLVGGNSSDTYIVDLVTNINVGVTTAALQDIILEDASGAGSDTIQLRGNVKLTTATTLSLSGGLANIENLDASLTATSKLNLTGNDANNVLTGNAAANTLTGGLGNDTLNGGAGIDTMIGGDGDDTYIVDNIADIVTEDSNEGTDLVKASVSYTLGDNVENLELTGTAAINGNGNDDANIITGNAGNNILDGKGGIDSLRGGKGNDTYIVDDADDEIIENFNEGTDLVKAIVSYTLSDNVENLTLTDGSAIGGTATLNGTGNALANTITGNAGNNILDGGAGVDKLIGGAGDDTYIVDLVRTGTAPANYKVALQDTITEAANAGNDTVQLRLLSGTDFSTMANATTLTLAANLENLDASATEDIKLKLTGNALANTLTGNDADNIIDGGAGNDILIGGKGKDTLKGGLGADVFKYLSTEDSTANAMDIITDFAQDADKLDLTDLNSNGISLGFTQTIAAAYSIWYEQFDDNKTFVSVDTNGDASADLQIQLIGNINLLASNFVNDTNILRPLFTTFDNAINLNLIDPSRYNNTDLYHSLDGNDAIILPRDSIRAALLGYDFSKVFHGGDGDDIIYGGSLNDIISGDNGVDTLAGGDGDDIYIVDLIQTGTSNATFRVALQDTITETTNAGNDTVKLNGNFDHTNATTLTIGANLEKFDASLTGTTKLNLTGNDLGNTLIGNAATNILNGGTGNDTLNGGTGTDTMIGSDGDDIYIVDNAADIVTELTNEGTDEIRASVTYSLGANVENLTLTGTIAINGTGNELNNIITGNTTNNILDGGTGVDTLIGGKGNDTYIVDNADDLVVENANEGTDLVKASIDYTLTSHVESLTLTGTDHINATGNELANIITGNSGNNILDGDAGIDTLTGGFGDDTYIVDLIQTGTSAATFRVALQDTITEAANAGNDTVKLRGSFDHLNATTLTLGANLENLNASATGATKLSLTGNALANTLRGNDADNILDGGAGNDYLVGGKGNDTLYGGAGDDILMSGDGLGINYAYLDVLYGGEGNDTYIISGYDGEYRPSKVIETQSVADGGIDTVITNYSYTLPQYVENLTFDNQIRTAGYTLRGVGNDLDNILLGDINSNLLIGGAGDDLIDGGIVLSLSGGGSQEDYLYGGLGNDKLYGHDGIDYYYINGSIEHQVAEIFDSAIFNWPFGSNVVYFNSSLENDTFRLFSGDTGVTDIYIQKMLFDLEQVDGIKRLVDFAATDASSLNIDASAAINSLNIAGSDGDNILIGSIFNDSINGGSGNDTIIGGSGSDKLYGGLGTDTFKWNLHDNGLTTDLTNATDTIFDFNVTQGDNLNFKDLLIGETSNNILQYLDIFTQNGSTEIRISTQGGFTAGNYNSANEDAHVLLFNTDIYRDTGISTEAALIQHMITNQILLIG